MRPTWIGARILRGAFMALALAIPSAGQVAAQQIEITGTVTDDVTLLPVPNALVEVLDRDGTPIEVTRGDASGRFRFLLDPTPIVLLRATGFAYSSVRRSLRVPEGETSFDVPFALTRAPIQIEGITVEGERSGITPGAVLFEQHRMLGKGTFFTGEQIRMRDRSIQDILLSQEGIVLRPVVGGRTNAEGNFARDSLVLSTMKGRGKCLNVMIDGYFVERQRSDFLDMDDPTLELMGDRSSMFEHWLEEIVAGKVEGMELYQAYEEVPEDLRIEAYPCGLIIIWQKPAWVGPGGGG